VRTLRPHLGGVCRKCGETLFKVTYDGDSEEYPVPHLHCGTCGTAWQATHWRGERAAMGEVRDEPKDVVSEEEGGTR
jgi:hypothetical protein